MFNSRLTHRANHLELHLEIKRLVNSMSFNHLADEKYIIDTAILYQLFIVIHAIGV